MITRLLASSLLLAATALAAGPRLEISFPASAGAQPITGRVYVVLSRKDNPEPRLQAANWRASETPFFGLDVKQWKPGQAVVIDARPLGYPLKSLRDVPDDVYFVQAMVNIYTEFHRADGHTIWAHMDQWEGQRFDRSPGSLYSEIQGVHLDPAAGYNVKIELAKAIPPVVAPPDTAWVKRVKIQSKLLTDLRQKSQIEAVEGSKGRSGEQYMAWEAVYGPVGDDGYPAPLWDKLTGEINHYVALYMRDHGYDLSWYVRTNWAKLGPQLKGKAAPVLRRHGQLRAEPGGLPVRRLHEDHRRGRHVRVRAADEGPRLAADDQRGAGENDGHGDREEPMRDLV